MRFPFLASLVACFLVLIPFLGTAQTSSDSLITARYEQAPLQTILSDLEKKTPLRFYYQSQWLQDIKVTAVFDRTPLPEVLRKSLEGTTLEFIQYHPFAIVIKPAGFVQPVLATKDSQGRPLNRVQVGSPQNASKAAKVTLRGRLVHSKTGEGVAGATVAVTAMKAGAMSDANGDYELSLPVGEHLVSYRVVGLMPEERIVALYNSGKVDVTLYENAVALNEVQINSERLTDQNVNSIEMGVNKLDMGVVRKMPTFMGEADVVKAVMLLPGVSSVGEGSGGFNVRGGSTDQNLVLMGGVPVYNPSHLFGFFSVFNPDAVQDVTLYRGGIPAQFGGRLSSVLDVKQKEGNKNKLTGKGALGPVTSRLVLEGPLGASKNTTFLVAGRVSYLDWFLKRLKDEQLRRSSASFYDITAQVNHQLGAKDKISIGGYYSSDAFGFTKDSLYNWQNIGASVKHTHTFSEKWVGSLSGVISKYSFEATDELASRASSFKNGLWSVEVKPELTYYAGKHQITAGFQGTRYEFQPGILAATSEESSVNGSALPYQQSMEGALYLSDEYTISPRWSAMVGLRFSSFWNIGPGDVYVYAPGETKRIRTIQDTLHFDAGQTIARYSGLEPRVSLKFSITENNSLKAGYQRMRQYIHLVSSTVGISPIDFWQTSNSFIQPQVGDQYSLGYFHNFLDNALEFSIEGYYKDIQNQLDYKEGADLWLNPAVEADLLAGKGRTYGAEVLLSKKSGRFTGWTSYTYARSQIKVASERPEEEINKGEWYSSNHDKPHTFNLVTAWQMNRRVALTSNFTYSTGRPTTAPIGQYLNDGRIIPIYGPRNQARIPDYHRLDLSLTIETNHKKDKKWEGRWNFSVSNVYGRKNAYSVFYRHEKFSVPKPYKLSVVGIPLPSISYEFKF
ncbi:TonB-dependent receptor [Nibribacter ruber]|uniref:TonB-dependent receptor n=1 Tax=Nibribacter ruber TaxID=2698458 RepID=A0A6P1P198_9BACT|nr:TonB-dependent receptor [Nibribacter ruber]QHL87373.1 TonB-dependent receptor [Nibribacter ruber]